MASMYGTPSPHSSTDVPVSKSLSAVHDCHNCLNGDAAISMNAGVANKVGMVVDIGMSVHCTECAEMAAVSCGTNHASDVSTPLRWILKKGAIKKKKLFTHVESHASAVSLLESGE